MASCQKCKTSTRCVAVDEIHALAEIINSSQTALCAETNNNSLITIFITIMSKTTIYSCRQFFAEMANTKARLHTDIEVSVSSVKTYHYNRLSLTGSLTDQQV